MMEEEQETKIEEFCNHLLQMANGGGVVFVSS